MISIIVLSVITGVLGLYYFFSKDSNYFKKHGIPFKSPIALLGNMGRLLTRRQGLHELIQELYNLHPEAKYVGTFEMTTPMVMIRDPELIKSIMLKNFDMFVDRRVMVDENLDPLLGKTLFSLRGDKWREVRAILKPSFTASKMKSMFKLMSEYATDFTSYLTQLPPEQRIMQMEDIFARYTADVIATCAFGVSVDSMRNPENEFYVYGKQIINFSGSFLIKIFILTILPRLGRLMNLKIVDQNIIDFFRNSIETTVKIRDENGIVRPDMLQMMMESRGKETELSIDDMLGHTFVFFVGGLAGTMSIMSFAAYEIAVNQDIYEKLQKEIDQILEETNGQISYEAINDMEYLDAVVNETLRKYPVATMMDRVCVKDFQLPPTLPGTKPFTIKKGDAISLPFYGLHHDAKYFENPEKFDPERFLGEQKKHNLNCGAYLPFGLGPRMCIGYRFALLEIKVLLFHVLSRCDLKTCEKTLIPLKFCKKASHGMQAEGGIWLKVLPRKKPCHIPGVKTF